MNVHIVNDKDTLNMNNMLIKGMHGGYFINCKSKKCVPDVYEKDKRLALWDKTAELTNVKVNFQNVF